MKILIFIDVMFLMYQNHTKVIEDILKERRLTLRFLLSQMILKIKID